MNTVQLFLCDIEDFCQCFILNFRVVSLRKVWLNSRSVSNLVALVDHTVVIERETNPILKSNFLENMKSTMYLSVVGLTSQKDLDALSF